jgi:hypothetical protein
MLAYAAYKAVKDKKKRKEEKNRRQEQQQQQQQGNYDCDRSPSASSQHPTPGHAPYSARYPQSPSDNSQHYSHSPPAPSGRSSLAPPAQGPAGGHSHYTTAEQQRMQQELSYAQHNEHAGRPQYNGSQYTHAPANGQVQPYQQGGNSRYQ